MTKHADIQVNGVSYPISYQIETQKPNSILVFHNSAILTEAASEAIVAEIFKRQSIPPAQQEHARIDFPFPGRMALILPPS